MPIHIMLACDNPLVIMAAFTIHFLSFSVLLLLASFAPISSLPTCDFPALFVFGDSLDDNGNGPFIDQTLAELLPYGVTWPGHGDLRFSNGRVLFADYLAQFLGLPALNPSFNLSEDFTYGLNYAVPGATVLPLMPYGFDEQINQHVNITSEVFSSADVVQGRPNRQAIKAGLYVIRLGANDYFEYLENFTTPNYIIANVVPLVVQATIIGLERLYENGARNFLIFGTAAHGCTPAMLANFSTLPRDSLGCISKFNEIDEAHANLILKELQGLRERREDATYTYVDAYAQFIHVLKHAKQYGFVNTLDACCGAGNRYPYGYNRTIFPCRNSTRSVYVCPNPNQYISFDGLHYSEAFNLQTLIMTIYFDSFIYPSDSLVVCRSRNLIQRNHQENVEGYTFKFNSSSK